jgi:hypothetical protein
LLASLLLAAVLALSGAATPADSARASWDGWPGRRFVSAAAPCFRHAALVDALRALEARHPGRLRLEQVGRSVEGRALYLLTVGRGPRRVLLWSQMHGNEPSATPALLDVADTLLAADPEGVLDRLTLLMLPMLNPDGAERYVRRNAQGIDINRDALALATPEGRLLKQLRERFRPELGFNLHDQNRRTTVGDTGVLASIALLAVAGDAQGTLTAGRARAKRVCSLLARTLGEFVPGGVARYDEDWNPRAFGDNLTAWGTPVVLIETGGLPAGLEPGDRTRLHYVGLLAALQGLARDDLAQESPALYEGLKRNGEGGFVDVLLAGGLLAQPSASTPYAADLAFDVLTGDLPAAGCPAGAPGGSRIRDVGDGRLLAAGRRLDVAGRLLVPAFTAAVHGLAARDWLDADAIDAMGRLGVARLRWQVPDAERTAALAVAARLAGPGRPAVEVVGDASPAPLLRVERRPAAPAGATLAAALDALAATWRSAGGDRPLGELIGGLTAAPAGPGPPVLVLAPDGRASLIVLRPTVKGALDPERLELERVFIDGREPAAARRPEAE